MGPAGSCLPFLLETFAGSAEGDLVILVSGAGLGGVVRVSGRRRLVSSVGWSVVRPVYWSVVCLYIWLLSGQTFVRWRLISEVRGLT